MEFLHVGHVYMDHRRWIDAQGLWALEAVPGLSEHHESVIAQYQLGMRSACRSLLLKSDTEPERRDEVSNGRLGILVQQVRCNRVVALRWVPHLVSIVAVADAQPAAYQASES